ncbi:protein YjjY [Klebsiella pneumoniae]
MTKVRNCVLDALSINDNNIISLVVGTFPLDPTVSKTADILTILTAT